MFPLDMPKWCDTCLMGVQIGKLIAVGNVANPSRLRPNTDRMVQVDPQGRRPMVPQGNPMESRGEPNNASGSQGVTLPTGKISDFTKTFLEQVKERQLGYIQEVANDASFARCLLTQVRTDTTSLGFQEGRRW